LLIKKVKNTDNSFDVTTKMSAGKIGTILAALREHGTVLAMELEQEIVRAIDASGEPQLQTVRNW
jgi:hypothetical protein